VFSNSHLNLVNLQIHSDEVSDGVNKYMNSQVRFETLNARREDYGRRQGKKGDETSRRARGVTHEAPLSRAGESRALLQALTAVVKIGKIHKLQRSQRSLAHPLHCPRTAPRTTTKISGLKALKSPYGDQLGDLARASFRREFLAFKSLIGRDRARVCFLYSREHFSNVK
ncbi:hypothetical protein ALC62_05578, partial [Cyphomyrmex costatus]